ncbi:MAG TPA: dodecin family protein [Gaiellaceae bacterium]|nr:dodecin family protein [Gaiellaceae bacterium]
MSIAAPEREVLTSVAKVIEITAESPESFEDAIRKAIKKASETVHGMKAAWVSQQQVKIQDGEVVGFRVDLKVTFVLD